MAAEEGLCAGGGGAGGAGATGGGGEEEGAAGEAEGTEEARQGGRPREGAFD